MYYIYVIQNECQSDDFYTGYTSNLKQRFSQHNSGCNTSTKGKKWKLVYYEAYFSESVARNRERMLKHDGRVKRYLMERIKSQF